VDTLLDKYLGLKGLYWAKEKVRELHRQQSREEATKLLDNIVFNLKTADDAGTNTVGQHSKVLAGANPEPR
jgi:hypothetical protein